MTDALAIRLLGWLLPLVLVPVVYVVFRWVTNHIDLLDRLPAGVKRIAVTLFGMAATTILSKIGIAMPLACEGLWVGDLSAACLEALNEQGWQNGLATAIAGVFVGLGAMGLHYLRKKPPHDPTALPR